MRICEEMCLLHRRLKKRGGLRETALHPPHVAGDGVERRKRVTLPGRARRRQGSFGVICGLGKHPQMELCAGQVRGRVQTARNVVIGQPVDQISCHCSTPHGLRGLAAKGLRPSDQRSGRRLHPVVGPGGGSC